MSKYAKEVNRYLLYIQKGDETKIKDLFDLTANHLKGMVNVYLNNKNDCEDVVIETFERVIRYIRSFNKNQDGYNWICTIARNIIRDHNIDEEFCESLDKADKADLLPDEKEIIDTKIDIYYATKNFDDINKEIFRRRFYFNETLEEIGKALGLCKSAVHKRIQNILKEIENYFKDR